MSSYDELIIIRPCIVSMEVGNALSDDNSGFPLGSHFTLPHCHSYTTHCLYSLIHPIGDGVGGPRHIGSRAYRPSDPPPWIIPQGMFLVMTAAEYISLSGGGISARLAPGQGKPESGLLLQLPKAHLVTCPTRMPLPHAVRTL